MKLPTAIHLMTKAMSFFNNITLYYEHNFIHLICYYNICVFYSSMF